MADEKFLWEFDVWGLEIEVRNVADALRWVQSEQRGWAPLIEKIQSSGGSYPPTIGPGRHLRVKLNELEAAVNGIGVKDSDSEDFISSRMEVLRQQFTQIVCSARDRYVPFSSATGQFVLLMFQNSSIDRTASALAYFQRLNYQAAGFNPNDHAWSGDFWAGKFDAHSFEVGINPQALEAQRTALIAARDEWAVRLRDLQSEYRQLLADDRTDLRARKDREEGHDRDFHSMIDVGRLAFSDAVKGAKDQHRQLVDLFTKHMALEGPVTYWSRRALWGHIGGGLLFLVALAAGSALAWYFQSLVHALLDGLTVRNVTTPVLVQDTNTVLDWPHYSIAGATLLLGAWGLRILLRIAFGLWDNGTDAGERAVIIQTYLALLKDPGGLPPEAITVLLQTIVRPGGNRGENPGLFDAEALKQAAELIKK